MNDRDLIQAHRKGDKVAFEQLVDLYVDRVYSFSRRLSGDASIADDATQETFIKVWKSLGKFDEAKSFKTWIFAIARNSVIDMLRKRKDVAFTSLDGDGDEPSFADGVADDAPLADVLASNADLREALDTVLSKIDAMDRSIVLLHDVEDLTFEEISGMVDRPMNTVKSRYRRAVMLLRDLLSDSEFRRNAPKSK